MIAIIKQGGKQYKVTEGDIIKISKLNGEVGGKIKNSDVLLISDNDAAEIKIGKPLVEGAAVNMEIFEHGREKKINVIKYKRKTRYRRKQGHRQDYTKIKILEIK